MTLEDCLWIAALAAVVHRERAHLEGDLAELAARLIAHRRPRAQA